ncbi:hypothetical protein KL86DES1_21220 [uncultured Desulfovibrio sp.]|uniref:Uncharacterized protein n=1 Tax=uncultured Desulfovibrio sp. TaxID=167968 RepID=A0A212L7K7_9BACT|nr:hypothetical protein KL86DES1_21220 [uncultured Desulfovibrio sp.]VZH34116.1 conserved protein of unknown function [Desulfovibrio sp. 86]
MVHQFGKRHEISPGGRNGIRKARRVRLWERVRQWTGAETGPGAGSIWKACAMATQGQEYPDLPLRQINYTPKHMLCLAIGHNYVILAATSRKNGTRQRSGWPLICIYPESRQTNGVKRQ